MERPKLVTFRCGEGSRTEESQVRVSDWQIKARVMYKRLGLCSVMISLFSFLSHSLSSVVSLDYSVIWAAICQHARFSVADKVKKSAMKEVCGKSYNHDCSQRVFFSLFSRSLFILDRSFLFTMVCMQYLIANCRPLNLFLILAMPICKCSWWVLLECRLEQQVLCHVE